MHKCVTLNAERHLDHRKSLFNFILFCESLQFAFPVAMPTKPNRKPHHAWVACALCMSEHFFKAIYVGCKMQLSVRRNQVMHKALDLQFTNLNKSPGLTPFQRPGPRKLWFVEAYLDMLVVLIMEYSLWRLTIQPIWLPVCRQICHVLCRLEFWTEFTRPKERSENEISWPKTVCFCFFFCCIHKFPDAPWIIFQMQVQHSQVKIPPKLLLPH